MKMKLLFLVLGVAVSLLIAGCTTSQNNVSHNQDTDQKKPETEEYRLGGQGPGGGIIFYDDLIGFDFDGDGVIAEDEKNLLQYSYLNDSRFLEAAPRGWNLPDTRDDPLAQWGSGPNIAEIVDVEIHLINPEPTNIRDTVGNGRRNTELILSYLNENTEDEGTAAHLCSNYNGGGLSDWFLPSVGELVLLYHMRDDVGGIVLKDYSTSSESRFNNLKWIVRFREETFGVDTLRKNKEDRVRPIRAF